MIFEKYFRAIKEKKELQAELSGKGIALNAVNYGTRGPESSRLFLCLVRSVLLFFAAFGTVGALVSAFDIVYNYALVIPLALLICVLIAFIYYNQFTFYFGYIVYFISFTVGIFSLYFYANSGYQAFSNIVLEKYSDFFNLTSYQEATEFITDRELTISVAMLFVIAFLALLLNIAISGYMSLMETFLLTFPLLQIPFYIDRKPGIIYLIMLLSVYITVALLGRSSQARIPNVGMDINSFISFKKRKGSEKIKYHAYLADGKSMLTTSGYSILLCTIFLLATMAFFYRDTSTRYVSNVLKNTTDEYVKLFVQNGVYGIFDRYSATGGLAKGKLGGVGSVRPDYETDLYVTFVPENLDTIYLKAYIGTDYDNNTFSTDTTNIYGFEGEDYFSRTMYSVTETIPHIYTPSKMEIVNVDADPTYDYMPYYGLGVANRETSVSVDETGDNYTLMYIPYDSREQKNNANFYISDNAPLAEYEKYVHDTYLGVNDNVIPAVESVIDEMNLNDSLIADPSNSTSLNNDALRARTLAIAEALKKHFWDNYPYTMVPGNTPRNADFVDYFLTKQKRGFCAHFAASSTLILRYMGIPARYVEGYAISLTDIVDAEAVDSSIDGWVGDPSRITLNDTGLVTVEVTDGSAHAWTEIYIDGYGWIPYDFTPPSTEVLTGGFSFSSLFSALMRSANTDDNTSANNANSPSEYSFNFQRTFGFLSMPLLLLLIMLGFMLIVYINWPRIRDAILASYSLKKGNINRSLAIRYHRFVLEYRKKNAITEELTVMQTADCIKKSGLLLSENPDENNDYIDMHTEILNRALYSLTDINIDEYNSCIAYFKKVTSVQK